MNVGAIPYFPKKATEWVGYIASLAQQFIGNEGFFDPYRPGEREIHFYLPCDCVIEEMDNVLEGVQSYISKEAEDLGLRMHMIQPSPEAPHLRDRRMLYINRSGYSFYLHLLPNLRTTYSEWTEFEQTNQRSTPLLWFLSHYLDPDLITVTQPPTDAHYDVRVRIKGHLTGFPDTIVHVSWWGRSWGPSSQLRVFVKSGAQFRSEDIEVPLLDPIGDIVLDINYVVWGLAGELGYEFPGGYEDQYEGLDRRTNGRGIERTTGSYEIRPRKAPKRPPAQQRARLASKSRTRVHPEWEPGWVRPRDYEVMIFDQMEEFIGCLLTDPRWEWLFARIVGSLLGKYTFFDTIRGSEWSNEAAEEFASNLSRDYIPGYHSQDMTTLRISLQDLFEELAPLEPNPYDLFDYRWYDRWYVPENPDPQALETALVIAAMFYGAGATNGAWDHYTRGVALKEFLDLIVILEYYRRYGWNPLFYASLYPIVFGYVEDRYRDTIFWEEDRVPSATMYRVLYTQEESTLRKAERIYGEVYEAVRAAIPLDLDMEDGCDEAMELS